MFILNYKQGQLWKEMRFEDLDRAREFAKHQPDTTFIHRVIPPEPTKTILFLNPPEKCL